MASRENRPSERVIFEAIAILKDPNFKTSDGWGGFDPTEEELVEQASRMAIMAAYERGDEVSGSDWRTSFTETPMIVDKIIRFEK